MARNPEQLKRIARELLTHPEQSYTEIAEKVGIDTHYPRINLYQTLQSDRYKNIMAEMTKTLYNEDILRQKLNDFLESPEQNKLKLEAIQLGMREKAMLTDKTINENHNYDAVELDKIRDKALKEAEDSLKSVLAGTKKQPEKQENDSINIPDSQLA